ncbi:AraC family transcriptional regulator [Desulfosporosinus sp. OT]|uniref:AraC family transcriptional regulator n=1 Tax=Desulfosporosinus sp. OT TaxID=913865 RepID=UPI000223AEF8|nr:AraC family transcriptional regulator [Desulfosporosinus sp. OT]EGW39618.1 bacterial regulatory helix-turn-helix s, AraC family protein [Desulfosporosinus sp. OT]
MEKFLYKKSAGITVLSASMTEFVYKRHSHEEYALGVTLRGIQQYHLDGQLCSSHRNGVMLFNPEQAHDGSAADKDGIDYVMLYIPTELLSEISGNKEILCFSAPIVYNDKLALSILNLAHCILNDRDEALGSELLLKLITDVTTSHIQTASLKQDALMQKSVEMIRYNLGTVLKLDDICRELQISKYRFIRLFKAYAGISPYQYFLNCKVECAKQLIEASEDIYTVVSDCGFFDLAHLNRHFKGIYGTTAYEYLQYVKM